MPASVKERKQFALPTFKEKRTDPANKTSLVREKLYVKGKLQSQFLAATLPRAPADGDDDLQIQSGGSVEDGGSTFTGYAASVTTLEEVSAIRSKLLCRPEVARSSHVMLAYRIATKKGFTENFDSDGDHGVGLEMLRAMQNSNVTDTVWVVTRACSPTYQHIGKRRFELAVRLSGEAMNKL